MDFVIDVMCSGCVFVMEYQVYNWEYFKDVLFEFYFVKLFCYCWYLIGINWEYKVFCFYFFDWIKRIVFLEEIFNFLCKFIFQDYFRDSFGIICDENLFFQYIVFRIIILQVLYLRNFFLYFS